MASVVFLCLFIVFQVTFCAQSGQQQRLSNQIQQLRDQLRQESDGAASLLQERPDNQENNRRLRNQANEYAYDLNNAIYQLQQLIQENLGNQDGQKNLQQSARRLVEYSHAVQQNINQQPDVLRNQLKSSLQNSGLEADNFAQYGGEQQGQVEGRLLYQLRRVLNSLLIASQRLRVSLSFQDRNQQEIESKLQLAVNGLSSAIQNVYGDDQQTGRELRYVAQRFAKDVLDVNRRLEEYLNGYSRQDQNFRNPIQQISNKLIETQRAVLSDVNSEEGLRVDNSELKNRIKTNVHNAGAQIQRLIQLGQGQQGNQDLNSLIQRSVTDALTSAKNLDRQFSYLSQKN